MFDEHSTSRLSSSLRRLATTTLTATVACAILAVPLASGASAKESRKPKSDKITKLQRECYRAMTEQIAGYTRLENGIASNHWLTDAHRSTLTDIAANDKALMVADRAAVVAATTLDALKAACQSGRGHAGLLRFDVQKARGTAHADHFDGAAAMLQDLIDQANTAVDPLETNGVDVTDLRALIAEVQAALDAAEAASGGLGDTVMAIVVGEGANAALADARNAVEQGRAALEEIFNALSSLSLGDGGGGGDAPPTVS